MHQLRESAMSGPARVVRHGDDRVYGRARQRGPGQSIVRTGVSRQRAHWQSPRLASSFRARLGMDGKASDGLLRVKVRGELSMNQPVLRTRDAIVSAFNRLVLS